MSAFSLTITLDLLVAALAVASLRGRRAGSKPAAAVPARVRIARRAGQHFAPEASMLDVRLAPVAEPRLAATMSTPSGEQFVIPLADVRTMRVWLRGRAVATVGDATAFGGTFQHPLSGELAGWELEITTVTGGLIRCYGALGSEVQLDLARLRRAVLASTTPRVPSPSRSAFAPRTAVAAV